MALLIVVVLEAVLGVPTRLSQILLFALSVFATTYSGAKARVNQVASSTPTAFSPVPCPCRSPHKGGESGMGGGTC